MGGMGTVATNDPNAAGAALPVEGGAGLASASTGGNLGQQKADNEHLAWLVQQGSVEGEKPAVKEGLDGGGDGQVCFVRDMAELTAAIEVRCWVFGGAAGSHAYRGSSKQGGKASAYIT